MEQINRSRVSLAEPEASLIGKYLQHTSSTPRRPPYTLDGLLQWQVDDTLTFVSNTRCTVSPRRSRRPIENPPSQPIFRHYDRHSNSLHPHMLTWKLFLSRLLTNT